MRQADPGTPEAITQGCICKPQEPFMFQCAPIWITDSLCPLHAMNISFQFLEPLDTGKGEA